MSYTYILCLTTVFLLLPWLVVDIHESQIAVGWYGSIFPSDTKPPHRVRVP